MAELVLGPCTHPPLLVCLPAAKAEECEISQWKNRGRRGRTAKCNKAGAGGRWVLCQAGMSVTPPAPGGL